MVTINILNYVPLPVTLSSGAVLKMCGALVALFFTVLETEGIVKLDFPSIYKYIFMKIILKDHCSFQFAMFCTCEYT